MRFILHSILIYGKLLMKEGIHMKRTLTGLQPSGEITLGNLIGSINQMIEYQNNYESYIFVANMHAITVNQDPEILRERAKKLVALYLACGIDPKKNTIFLQSENPYHANLSWVLECNTYFGEAGRMTQFKDKSQKHKNFSVGLFTYPMLMAADILLYDADYVPVGLDQKQHVELTRDIAIRFNKKYGDTFKIPEPIIPQSGAKITDLQEPTKKMSKSAENLKGTILVLDDVNVTRKKIMSAVTDSENVIKYDPENKPGISNLLTIYSVLTNTPIPEVEKKFKDANYGELKKNVADVVCETLENIQKKYQSVLTSGLVDKVLDEGRDKTIKIAKQKVYEVFKKVGLSR